MGRKTEQRDALKHVIEHAKRPLTVQEIHTIAQDTIPGLGIATVYRNLKRFTSEGVITTVGVPGEPDRYEVADLHHHHHFHCERCDKMFDVHTCAQGFESMLPPGFKLTRHEVTLYGACGECA